MKLFFKIFYVFLSFFLFNFYGFTESFNIESSKEFFAPSEELKKASLAVWKIKNDGLQGTGFFISPKHFVTCFHNILGLLKHSKSLESVKLVHNHNDQVLKIKKIHSVYVDLDLALLEIDGVSDVHLTFKDSPPGTDEDLFVLGYPHNNFRIIQKISPLQKTSFYDRFFVNYSVLSGISGGPVLSANGELTGMTYLGHSNLMTVINIEHLRNFIKRDIGFSCEETNTLACVHKALVLIHNNAKARITPALHLLSKIYLLGFSELSMQENYERAFYITSILAKQGDSFDQYQLAGMYYAGQGVIRDRKKAAYWLILSAEQGNSIAQYQLANMYYNGTALEQSYEKALYWLQKSARQGFANAQYQLAIMYHVGEGVQKNPREVLYWLSLASSSGYVLATQALYELLNQPE